MKIFYQMIRVYLKIYLWIKINRLQYCILNKLVSRLFFVLELGILKIYLSLKQAYLVGITHSFNQQNLTIVKLIIVIKKIS